MIIYGCFACFIREAILKMPGEFRTTLGAGRSRRCFLKLAGGTALAGAAVATLPLALARAKATAADFIEQDKFPASGEYISAVFNAGQTFSAVGIYWEALSGNSASLAFQVRVSSDGAKFSDWFNITQESDDRAGPVGQYPANRVFGNPILASGQYVQYRVTIPNGVSLSVVGLSFLDSSPSPVKAIAPPVTPDTPNQPTIISRASWGANENLRFHNGTEIWPREYVPVKAIIIHHSETSNTYNADPSVDVRSIYYYHAITKGWGDIGYNYLIDWKGNIYEGRYGGDNVVAGHALQYNPGSIGICLIGSFTSTRPTDAQLASLTALLIWKADAKKIDALARIFFVDKTINTICAHRDVMNTSCPGQVAYDLLPKIRADVAAKVIITPAKNANYGAELVSLRFSPTTLPGGQSLRIDATIKNTGDTVLETQGPDPGYTYEEAQDYAGQGFPKISSKFRLTVDFSDPDNKPNPYRWGLGKSLQPGESTSIYGYIKLNSNKATEYFGGIVQEYVKYHAENIGRQPVSVIPSGYPTQRAASRTADSNIRYFNETGHNLGYAFRTFWERNGALPIFGYPLTEEFKEVSPTDNKVYTVQYFERNRFEYHPENKGTPFEVLLGLLGVQLTVERKFPKGDPFKSSTDRWYFPETGYSLGGSFLRYWVNNGGLGIFGYPISDEFAEKNPDDGKTYTVQYFQRNRFEYHPEFTNTKSEVLLGLLGKDVLRRRSWLQPGL